MIISKELPTTAEGQKTSHTFNDNDSFTSSLSSTVAKNVSKDLQAEYETELAYVHSSVLRKHSEVTKTFKEWEKLLTTGNDFLEPTLDDIEKNKKGYNLYKILHLCRQLSKHWKITVHLYNIIL